MCIFSMMLRLSLIHIFDLRGEFRHLFERVVGEEQLDALGFEQGDVLFGQGVLRLFEDANEVFDGKRLEFDPDRETALQLRDEVARFGNVESAGGNEQDVVGAHEAVAGVDGGAFDNGQDVALDAFAANVGTVAGFAAGDLVDFIEENDTARFDALQGGARDLIHVDQLLLFLLHQVIERLGHAHLALPRLLTEQIGQHVLEVDAHFLDTGEMCIRDR